MQDVGIEGQRGTGGPPLISVVIPVLDGMPWIDLQLRALSAQEVPVAWEVLVCDNGSLDHTRTCVQRWCERDSRICLVDASARRGAAAARNLGVSSARGGLLAFCDADDVVRPGWIAAMAEALVEADLAAGVFDFGALHGESSPAVPAATAQLGFLPFGLSANLAVRRTAFDAVRGFDEQLSPEEDVDLCWRLQQAGFRFVVTEAAVVEKREHDPGLPTFRAAWAYGRCGPRLFARYRSRGMRRDLRGAAKSWIWLLLAVPGLFRRSRRRRWIRAFAIRCGRLVGSAKLRVFFP